MHVRVADPRVDAEGIAEIYRPAVLDSVATFETDPPDAAEMGRRMAATLERHPWLVAQAAGEVVGYAYAGPHHARAGYRWSVNISAYVRADQQGRGVGRALYGELLALLRAQGVLTAYAGIAVPNPASERLHAAIGMRPFAVYEAVGWKLGSWRDVAWWSVRLADPLPTEPGEPVPFPLLGRLRWPDRGATPPPPQRAPRPG